MRLIMLLLMMKIMMGEYRPLFFCALSAVSPNGNISTHVNTKFYI